MNKKLFAALVALFTVSFLVGVARAAPKPSVTFTLSVVANGTDRAWAQVDAQRSNGTKIKSFGLISGLPESYKFEAGSPLAKFCVTDVQPGYAEPEPECVGASTIRRRVAGGPSSVRWTLKKAVPPVTRSRPRVRVEVHPRMLSHLYNNPIVSWRITFRGLCTGGGDTVGYVWGESWKESYPILNAPPGNPYLELIDGLPCEAFINAQGGGFIMDQPFVVGSTVIIRGTSMVQFTSGPATVVGFFFTHGT